MTVKNEWFKPYLLENERYCKRCGYIDTYERFGTDGFGHGVCPICKIYQVLVQDNTIPITELFRINRGNPKYQKTCHRCGKVLENINDGEHYMTECDEILEQTWGVSNS